MENKIKEIIKKEFDSDILEIKRLTEGYSHYMYFLRINKNPHEIIIRFSNNKNEEFGIRKEKYIIETLSKNKIPAPKIYAINDDYMILEKLRGIRLDTIWNYLSKQEKIQISEELGKILKKIHSIRLDKFGEIIENGKIKSDIDDSFRFRKEKESISFNPFLRETLVSFGKDFSRLLSYNHLTPEFVCELQKYIYSNLKKIDYKGSPVLCHGDFHNGHVFVEKIFDKYYITGLIDFEFARSYPPEYDFLKLHRQGLFDDQELKQALIKEYGNIDEEVVKIHRLLRDIGFSQVILDAGNKEESDKMLKKIKENIGFKGDIFITIQI